MVGWPTGPSGQPHFGQKSLGVTGSIPIFEGTPAPGHPADKRLCLSDTNPFTGPSGKAWLAVLEVHVERTSAETWAFSMRTDRGLRWYPTLALAIILGCVYAILEYRRTTVSYASVSSVPMHLG